MQPTIDRDPRVRFKHPVRVVPIGGPPRAYRVLAANLSREGMFLRMPTPFDTGTKVALSLEAGGRVLPFAQAEVVWRDLAEVKQPGRGAGFGVRFTGFLHPRAHELVDYLVANLETGKPLSVPGAAPGWSRRLAWVAAGLLAVGLGAGVTFGLLRLVRGEPPVAAAVEVQPAAPEVTAAVVEAQPELVAAAVVEGKPALVADAVVEARLAPVVEAQPEPLVAPAADEPGPPDAQTLAIPSGAVKSIIARVEAQTLALTLTLAPGAVITKAFVLHHPDRLAIDVRGPAPRRSHVVSGTAEVRKVRVGKLPRGTRVVLDLARTPGTPVVVSGSSVSVPLR